MTKKVMMMGTTIRVRACELRKRQSAEHGTARRK